MTAGAAAAGAGRGVLVIAFAKFYFMIAGLVIQLRLPSILSRTMFGAYTFVSSVVSPVNNVMITGSIQAVSRFTAQTPETARRVQLAGLRMHLLIGLPVALVFIAAAPLVAFIMHDASKTAPLMMSGLIVGGYAFYAVFVGTANGLRQFHKQAGLDVTFATLRVTGILGMAMAGLGVVGVIAGWVVATFIILAFASAWVGMPGTIAAADRMSVRPLMGFFAGVAIYLILFNVLMSVDTWLLKRLSTEYYQAHLGDMASALDRALPWARQASGYAPDASKLADVQVAYYGAAQNLARLPYQAIIAATFVIFPLVSRSTFTDDRETTRRYVEITLRYSVIFAMLIAVVMAANPAELLGVVYPADYAYLGGPALAALAIGNVAFAVFAINGTLLNGSGNTMPAIITAAVTLAIAAIGNYIAIPMVAPGHDGLMIAASVTGVAMIFGAALSGVMLYRKLGAFVPVKSLVRVVLATAIAIGVGRVLPLHGKLMAIAEAGLIAALFLVILVVTRELGRRDLAAIVAVRKKRAQGETP